MVLRRVERIPLQQARDRMSPQARHGELDVYDSGLAQGMEGIVPTVKRQHMTRLLEVAVFLLATVWGLQVFGLWVKFLQWGTLLEFPQ